jgi:3-phenylpropionate/trans-cinnamate dioxygenase ferredoxin subunit
MVESENSQYEIAASVDDLKDGSIMPLRLKGTDIILVRVGQSYYAAENHCPHSGSDISQSTLDGTILTCPFHGSKFDLIDGRIVRWTDWTSIKAPESRLFRPILPLTVYPVKIQDNNILVKI